MYVEYTGGSVTDHALFYTGHNWMIGQGERRWDCHGLEYGAGYIVGSGSSPGSVREWEYYTSYGWQPNDDITVTAGSATVYASLEMAVGKDAAPLVLAAGSLAALATLTLLAVTMHHHRAAAQAPGVEHVPLADFDECADSDDAELDEASTTDDDSEAQEREKLTALV